MFEDTRRRLIEVNGGGPLSPAALCEVQRAAGAVGDVYRGPYLLGAPGAAALLANCSGLGSGQVAAPPAAAPGACVCVEGASGWRVWRTGSASSARREPTPLAPSPSPLAPPASPSTHLPTQPCLP